MTHWLEKVLLILEADTSDLRQLAILAGGNPTIFYKGSDLIDVDISGQDLRGMKFTVPIDAVLFDRKTQIDNDSFVISDDQFWIQMSNIAGRFNFPANSPDDYLSMAKDLTRLTLFSEAIRILEIGYKKFPSAKQLTRHYIDFLLKQNYLSEAAYIIEEDIQMYPKDSYGYIQMAKVFSKRSDLMEAKLWIQKGLTLEPLNSAAWRELLYLAQRLGDRSEILRISKEMTKMFPKRPDIAFSYGELLESGGDVEGAIELYADLADRKLDPIRAIERLGDALNKSGRFDEALKLYRNALAQWPARLEPKRHLVRMLAQMGRLTEAMELLESVDNKSEQESISLYNWFAKQTRAMGNVDFAIEIYSRAAKRWPTNVLVRKWLGEFLLSMGKNDAAIAMLASAADADPLDDRPWKWLSSAYRKLGRFNDRDAALSEGMRRFPNSEFFTRRRSAS